MSPNVFHNVKENPYDKLGPNTDPTEYDRTEDGRYVKKQTYSVGINDLLLPEYFDLKRLKTDGVDEIHRTYQKLREKRDIIRNTMMLGRIVLPYEYVNPDITKSSKIKFKRK